jgi:hypothetical protein
VFEAGDGFYEEGDVHLARNIWDVDTVLYATWIMPSHKQNLTVPVETPRGCDIS